MSLTMTMRLALRKAFVRAMTPWGSKDPLSALIPTRDLPEPTLGALVKRGLLEPAPTTNSWHMRFTPAGLKALFDSEETLLADTIAQVERPAKQDGKIGRQDVEGSMRNGPRVRAARVIRGIRSRHMSLSQLQQERLDAMDREVENAQRRLEAAVERRMKYTNQFVDVVAAARAAK